MSRKKRSYRARLSLPPISMKVWFSIRPLPGPAVSSAAAPARQGA
jgi:hypothetical protein